MLIVLAVLSKIYKALNFSKYNTGISIQILQQIIAKTAFKYPDSISRLFFEYNFTT